MQARRCALSGIALCLLFWARGAAQNPAQNPPAPAESPESPQETKALRVETTLVQIPVSVTDTLNRFVLGLDKRDFRLYEDGVEQQIEHFSGEDAPLSVGL